MSRFLENKKILLVTTQFYGYEQKIITAIRNQGAELTVYFDDPVSYTRLKFLKNWISSGTRTRVNRFYRGYIIKYTRKKHFDYIFFLKGSIMSEPFLQTLRRQHPNALMIQYQWDSLANFNYAHLIKNFDISFTFDQGDAARVPALTYLPTFALDEFFDLAEQRKKMKQDIDVSFVGSNHSDRLKLLRKLRTTLDKQKLIHKFYVYLPFIVSFKSAFITRRMKPGEIMWKPISRKKYKNLLLRSRYVLDLPSPKQSGVSLRTYEALASGCTFITTSKTLDDEPFFDEKNVIVVEAETLDKSVPAILKQSAGNEAGLLFEEYSLTAWVKKLFTIAAQRQEMKTRTSEKVGE